MPITIREARPDEHAAVGDLTVAGYEAFYTRAEIGDYARVLRGVPERAAGGTVLVAVDGDALIGTVTYVDDARSPMAELQRADEASIRMLAVPPGQQRRGLGRALTDACVERARAAGKRALVLHADAIMPVSQHLYGRMGFVRDHDRDFVAADGTHLLGYTLRLGPGERGRIELHRHLEGSLRLASILEAARDGGVPLPADTPEDLAPRVQVLAPMGDLMEVLAAFDVFQRSFVSLPWVERFAFEAVEDAALEGVRLLELRFSPDFMARPHGLDWDGLMEAVVRGVARAKARHDVAVGLIAIASRGYGVESAAQTAAFAARWRHALVGFDLADDEVRFPSELFVDALAPVRDAGLPLTVHSGEAAGPEYVQAALDLGAVRIGHGVAVARDEALIARVIAQGVALETCPTSNVRTRAVPSLAEHPARALLRRGVAVTINSDDPGLFGIDLTHELEVARTALGFDDADLAAATRNALRASFLPEPEKAALARHFAWAAD